MYSKCSRVIVHHFGFYASNRDLTALLMLKCRHLQMAIVVYPIHLHIVNKLRKCYAKKDAWIISGTVCMSEADC